MSACTEWTGARTSAGYGERRVDGRVVYVHRWVWEQAYGAIPEGLVVMHTCDNPPCFLLDHLALGTQAANAADMMAKGRGRGQFPPRTHCQRGHELSAANVYVHPKDGVRECRACRRAREVRH